jgi:DNA primase
MPKDIQKPVYGIDMIPQGCTSLIVCESCLNALTAVKYGKPAVALLGTGNPYQIQQLKELGIREFIFALDPDEAGKKGTARLKRELKKVALVWEYADSPEGKDLNDLDFETFNNLTLI